MRDNARHVLWLAFLAVAARADISFPLPTEVGSGVTIKISSPVTSVPHFGFLPVRVSVENLTTNDGTWRFRFDAGAPRMFPGVASTTFELSAPATQTREAWFYVPLAGPGITINAAALTAGSGASGAQLPSAPPNIPGVYPDPRLPGVTYDERRNISSTSAGLVRTFTITQTGPASALPPIPPGRLPPRATTSITPHTGGNVTRTTTIPVTVNTGGSFSSGPTINPSTIAMTNARQELQKAGFVPPGSRTSISVQINSGAKAGTQEVTVSVKQTGPAATLPLPPISSLPPGFTGVNVTPEPGSPGNVTREFTYVENVSTIAPGIGASVAFPPPRALSSSAAEAEARKLLAPTKLLEPQTSVKTSVSIQYVSLAAMLGSGTAAPGAYQIILFEQTGPAAALPAPAPALLPGGVRATVFPAAGGAVTRVISVIDPALVSAMFSAAASASGASMVATQTTNIARVELQRLGFLRTLTGVTISPPTTRSSGAPGAPSPDTILLTETGPANVLPSVPPGVLPIGITCNLTPGAISGEVARNFVVNIPGFLAGGGAVAGLTVRRAAPSGRISGMMPVVNMLTIEAVGPGAARNSRATFPNAASTVAMGPLATTPALEQVVRGKFSSSGSRSPPNISGFEPAQVPADWRVWSSFNAVLLPAEEFEGLDGARRAALRTWVAAGGVLFLAPEATGDSHTERIGAGRIELLSEPIADIAPTDIFSRLQLEAYAPGMPDRDRATFSAGTTMGDVVKFEPSETLWISLFLVVFAALIGPVNLFWLAPATKRHRLFFTTPLISLAGAVAVGVAIVLQDGVGGDGVRRALVWLVPGESQAAVFQEQGSRSGLLVGRDFTLDEGVLCAVLPVDGNVYTSAQSSGVFTRERSRAGGDWFGNRARQAHLLRSLAPTRARLEFVGAAPDGAPIVESTLTTELRDFRMRDADGKTWSAASVPTGQRVTLQSVGAAVAPSDTSGNGTANFANLLKEAGTLTEPWQWTATGGATDLAPIVTLRAIRWQDEPIVYAGFVARPGGVSSVRTKGGGNE